MNRRAATLPFQTMRTARTDLLILASMAFMSMFSRVMFSPLLITMQEEFAIGTARAARFFLTISVGYTIAILFSGHLASRVLHRGTIIVFGSLVVVGLIVVALSKTIPILNVGFLLIGLGTGLYPPSGVSSITEIVHGSIRGQAMALHEVGPNLSFMVAPLMAALLLPIVGWRGIVAITAGIAFVLIAAFSRFSIAGRFPGTRPGLRNLREIVRRGRFWATTVTLALAASSTLGVFAIMPVYLVQFREVPLDVVSTVISLSRAVSLISLLAAGVLIDRFGVFRILLVVMIVTGFLTILLGVMDGAALLGTVFVQPLIITAAFPAVLVALSDFESPSLRSLAVSIMIPIVNIVSSGLYPTVMGALMERHIAEVGFVTTGVLMIGAVALLKLMWNR